MNASASRFRLSSSAPSSTGARVKAPLASKFTQAPSTRSPVAAMIWRSKQCAQINSCPAPSEMSQPIARQNGRSEEHTSELQSLMRISYAVFCLKKKKCPNKTFPFIYVHSSRHLLHQYYITL